MTEEGIGMANWETWHDGMISTFHLPDHAWTWFIHLSAKLYSYPSATEVNRPALPLPPNHRKYGGFRNRSHAVWRQDKPCFRI